MKILSSMIAFSIVMSLVLLFITPASSSQRLTDVEEETVKLYASLYSKTIAAGRKCLTELRETGNHSYLCKEYSSLIRKFNETLNSVKLIDKDRLNSFTAINNKLYYAFENHDKLKNIETNISDKINIIHINEIGKIRQLIDIKLSIKGEL